MIVVSLALVYVESQPVQMANGNTARRQLGQAGSASDAGGPFLFYFLECTLILYRSDAFPPLFLV